MCSFLSEILARLVVFRLLLLASYLQDFCTESGVIVCVLMSDYSFIACWRQNKFFLIVLHFYTSFILYTQLDSGKDFISPKLR